MGESLEHKETKDEFFVRKYPHLSAAEREEAKDLFRQYAALALRVLERLERDPEAMARFDALTAESRASRMNGQVPGSDIKISNP
jgi:hypothetical protein